MKRRLKNKEEEENCEEKGIGKKKAENIKKEQRKKGKKN